MKIIAGLGNPGDRYLFTRHNAGFMAVDRLAVNHSLSFGRKRFDALVAEGTIAGIAVTLLKPQTFMNLSGAAVGRFVHYFKCDPAELLVVHDDLDLPFGTLRIKSGGGDGGHKGLKSIIEHLGTEEFLRLRLGIGKPSHKDFVESYVLEPFGSEERTRLPDVLDRACDALEEILRSGPQAAMNRFNARNGAQKPPAEDGG